MTNNDLTLSWLGRLTNPHHDGTTQQIDDFVTAFVTDNARFIEKRQAVHLARQNEDSVWMTVQRDPAAEKLAKADNTQDAYISAARFIIQAHAGLPDGEPTKTEAKVCEQVFTDYKFRTDNAYGAEADKIIQMVQDLRSHQAFLTQTGAWTFLTKAEEQAYLVRQYLSERALTLATAVKGKMKAARQQTDTAIAELYKVITAMMELMPTPELTALYNQLRGIELYARKYYIKEGASSGSSGNSGSSGSTGSTGDSGDSGSTGDSGNSTDTPGTDQGGVGTIETGDGGTTPGTNTGTDTGDTGGTGTIDTGDNGGDNGGGTTPDPNDPPVQDE